MNFVLYQPEDGRIVSVGWAATEAQAQLQATGGTAILIDATGLDTTHYVLDGAIAERPALSLPPVTLAAGGAAQVVSPPLPAGTIVTIGGGPAAMSAQGEVVHQPAAPGLVRFDIEPPWPWQPAVLTIFVQEA